MQSGTEPSAAHPRPPLRRIAAVPLGTLFIGSTLVALGAPSWADTTPTVTLIAHDAEVAAGETASLTLGVTGEPDDPDTRFCLFDPAADNGFTVGELTSSGAAGSSPASAEVTGEPEETVDVTATLKYAPATGDTECADVAAEAVAVQTAPVRVTVEEEGSPEPSPDPDPEPSDPAPEPTPEPTPSPTSPAPTPSPPEEEPSGSPSAPPSSSSPSAGPSEDGRPSSTATASRPPAPPHSPVTTRDPDDREADDRDRPELPSGAAELPPLDPPGPGLGDGGLADLPTVEPGDRGDGNGDTAAASASEPAVSPAVTPAVLLLFLLLLLLLSAPLSPTRRVRIGAAYKGRRRRT
ncbi:hypothetical protein ACFOVU_21050 [Nocardiopsis sediminis]|uniref:Uncharacterized protein n=1 Tax=Nocardiopsis sediminis TaxID=1778267 RepID=A0ABV8FTV4_9ACTN